MVLKGIVEEIIYRNEDNNYTVLVLNVNNELITAVGKMAPVTEGEMLEVNGDFSKHSKYGEQFSCKSVKSTPPASRDGIIRYLSSGLIRGIGPITAMHIVEKFGEDTLDIMEFNPDKLSEVRGISEKKAIDIAESFADIKKMQNAVMLMQQYNISTNLAIKIYNVYKGKTETILKSNPYKLVEDIDGVGFFTADRIAKEMGISENSDFRYRACVLHVLKENSDKNGNTFMFQPNLEENVTELLRVDIDVHDHVEKVLNGLVMDSLVKVFSLEDNIAVMLMKFYNIEKLVSATLKLLDCYKEEQKIVVDDEIKLYEQLNKLIMHENQKQAVDMAINNGISIITGGPGTGKTTIIKCILQIFKNMGKRVQLMAPTGRAAKRLSESTGMEALTIHRALEVNYSDLNLFNYNSMNKLPYEVIIVDEVSMVDIQLMYYLVRAIRRGSKLILVGDKDQLPSVGAGNVLADILKSQSFAVQYLTQIYRQDENSLIISNAHDINNGKMPTIDNNSSDFFFVESEVAEQVLGSVINMCTTRIPKFLSIESSKVQVLAPMKAGICGIDNMNKCLQEVINPPSLKKFEIETEKFIYRTGDRIMQITNNYERTWTKTNGEYGTGVFNGDMGIIQDINMGSGELTIQFEDERVAVYLRGELGELTLSYAITIHKSQGSEFDAVIIPILNGPPMLLTRNLLYTAVTRAKKMVVLLGNKAVIKRMIKNNHTQVRYTMLSRFLLENESGI